MKNVLLWIGFIIFIGMMLFAVVGFGVLLFIDFPFESTLTVRILARVAYCITGILTPILWYKVTITGANNEQ